MAHNIKWSIDQDGGSSTRPLSTWRRNCQPACRRPFPACSTALCVWLLTVEEAALCSACVLSRALFSRVPPGALPSFLHACSQCLGPAHHARSCACGCTGRDATMQLPGVKTTMRTRRKSGRPAPIYSCSLLPSSLMPHDSIITPTMTHTKRTSSGSNGAPRGSNGAPSGR